MSPRQQRFFEIARHVSFLSDFDRVKIGSILVRNKKVIVSSGSNMRKSHPYQYELNQMYKTGFKSETSFIHSELATLMAVKFIDVSGCDIYIYRECIDGSIGNSMPCCSCYTELQRRGINRVFFTSTDGYHCIKIER